MMETKVLYSNGVVTKTGGNELDTLISGLWEAVSQAETAQVKATELARSVESAKEAAELVKALAVDAAYANGRIQGKNAEERARAETILLAGDAVYKDEQKRLRNAEFDYERAKVDADLFAKRVSAHKAVMQTKAAWWTLLASGNGNGHGEF
jgi:hypothetical protein